MTILKQFEWGIISRGFTFTFTRRRGTSFDGDYLAHGTGIPRRNAPPKTHIKVRKAAVNS